MTTLQHWKQTLDGGTAVLNKTDREPTLSDHTGENVEQRIVIICPYPNFSASFSEMLMKIDPNLDIDEVSDAHQPRPPYIDVATREHDRAPPTRVIDFRILNSGTVMVDFDGYTKWTYQQYQAGITEHRYFMTRGNLDQVIDMQRQQAGKGWNRQSFDISPIRSVMEIEARVLLGRDFSNLQLFYNVVGDWEHLFGKRTSDFSMPDEDD